MALNVKKDDYVKIIAGKDKGKACKVIGVDNDTHRILIEGKDLKTVNKKAVKARKASDKGGIVEQPATIDVSNVMPICAACGKTTRVGHKMEGDKKVRICKKCGAVLVTKKIDTEKKAKAAVRKKAKAVEKTEE